MTASNHPPTKYRYRLVFAKNEQIKFISHLDLALAWERALRRARIPLLYSQGFNPRPKMQVASGLPLGTTGQAEIIDILVSQPLDPQQAFERIQAVLPAGIKLHSITTVALKAPSLQHLLRQADYQVVVETDETEAVIVKRIESLLQTDKIIQTRRRRGRDEEFDMRPWLHDLRLVAVRPGEAQLHMRLTAGQFGNLRPETVLKSLGFVDNWAAIDRTKLIFEAVE